MLLNLCLFCTLTFAHGVILTSAGGHWLKVHCWPFFSPFLLPLLPCLPLIVPFVLSFPLPVSYSSFSCWFLLAILPPLLLTPFFSLLIPLLLHPPTCTYARTVNPFLSSAVLFDFLFPLSSFSHFVHYFLYISVLLHATFSSVSSLHLLFPYPPPSFFPLLVHLFFWSVSLFLSPPLSSPFIIASWEKQRSLLAPSQSKHWYPTSPPRCSLLPLAAVHN